MTYVAEIQADSPRAWYRMDESSGNIQDSSGNANHATSTGGAGSATYQQTGAITSETTSKAIKFSNYHFQVPDHTTLDLADIFTLECWFKFNTNPGERTILTKQTGAYELRHSATGAMKLVQSDVGDIVTSTSVIPSDSAFHHLAATKTGATVKLYLDSVDVTGSVSNATFTDNSSALRVGGYIDTWRIDGWLDEVAVYATALSAARVAAHYAAAFGQTILPDADTASGNWAAFGTASLWQATSDSSDSTYMFGTAS